MTNQNTQKIKTVLISVSDKTGIIELANFLTGHNVKIISTGGTFGLLLENGIEAIEISQFTGFPEIMDGRVKTLHPKVHGALLGVLENPEHQKQAKDNQISCIDLAIINLYPFVQTVKKGANYEEVIENIDIGGPSMIRSAAKNHLYKTIITDPADYKNLIDEMQNNQGSTTLEFRKVMAKKAFNTTAYYDQAIASYFNLEQNVEFPPHLILPASLKQTLRYGENSHQKAAVYADDFVNFGLINSKQIQGKELSYNNFNDADAAFNLALEFVEPVAVIVKHANPCGVAIDNNIKIAYKRAFESDSKSAFGGILAINRKIDKELALAICQVFYEVIIAPEFSDEAQEVFATKKNLRLLEVAFCQPETRQKQLKSIAGGFLLQEVDDLEITQQDLNVVSKIIPSSQQIKQQIFASKICKHIKSNGIVVVNNFQTVGIGAGQTSRVDAVQIACHKAANFTNQEGKITNKAIDGILASDAFFPFVDNIEIAHKYGIGAIIATCGSIRDDEVILACDNHQITLSFIKSRHFKH